MLESVVLPVFLLGVLIFAHELGHFLVAKLCRVKVLRFSIGFGPKLLGFRRGETEYQVSLLPLGGYVKMAGEQPGDDVSPEDADRGYLAQPPFKRAAISAAGPLASLAFPVLVYFFLFVGTHQELSARVGSVEPGSPAAAAGLQPGDTLRAVNGQPVATFEELVEVMTPLHGQPLSLTVERDGKRQVVETTATTHYDQTLAGPKPRGALGVSSLRRPTVLGVPPGSPAAASGLKTFDRVTAVNGQPVADEVELYAALEKAQGPLTLTVARPRAGAEAPAPGEAPPSDTLTVTLERQPGEGFAALGAEPVGLYVDAVTPDSPAAREGLQRGDRLLAVDGEPLASAAAVQSALAQRRDTGFTLTWRSASGEEKRGKLAFVEVERENWFGKKMKVHDAGFRLRSAQRHEVAPPELVSITRGPWESAVKAVQVVAQKTAEIATGIVLLVTGRLSLDNVGGPVLLFQAAGASAQAGMPYFFDLMALISINLGLINLLPIPILDGFGILSAVWEGVRRRPISIRAREVANMVGLVMLVMLMGLAFYNDLFRR